MSNNNDSHVAREDAAARSRRDFLKKAGRFAVYTPPTMMVLMHPGRYAIAQSTGNTTDPRYTGPTSATINHTVVGKGFRE